MLAFIGDISSGTTSQLFLKAVNFFIQLLHFAYFREVSVHYFLQATTPHTDRSQFLSTGSMHLLCPVMHLPDFVIAGYCLVPSETVSLIVSSSVGSAISFLRWIIYLSMLRISTKVWMPASTNRFGLSNSATKSPKRGLPLRLEYIHSSARCVFLHIKRVTSSIVGNNWHWQSPFSATWLGYWGF